MPYFILSILVQLALVVHVLKTGRNSSWIFILLFFPLIGGLAYFIVEIIPELSSSRAVRSANQKVSRQLDPNKSIRHATENLLIADTVENTLQLAKECLNKGRYEEAEKLYRKAMKGVYENDPLLLESLARVQFLKQEYLQAKSILENIVADNPDYKSADGHLLYAKTLLKLDMDKEAVHEFEVLKEYYPSPEPLYWLGVLLTKAGRQEEGDHCFREIAAVAKRSGSHYRNLHKEWIKKAEKALSR